jgi:hypothetical protein
MEDRLHHRAGRDPGTPRPSLTGLAPTPHHPADPAAATGQLGLHENTTIRSRGNVNTPSKPADRQPNNHQHAHTPLRTLRAHPLTRKPASQAARIGGFRLSSVAGWGEGQRAATIAVKTARRATPPLSPRRQSRPDCRSSPGPVAGPAWTLRREAAAPNPGHDRRPSPALVVGRASWRRRRESRYARVGGIGRGVRTCPDLDGNAN